MIRRALGSAFIAALLLLAGACGTGASKGADTPAVAAADSRASAASAAPSTPLTPVDSASKGDTTPASTPAATKPSSPSPAPTPSATPSETVLTGRVVAGGLAADQKTMLQVEGGGPTTLTGPLEPELRRLSSATVWVAGAPGAAAPNATFAVSRYEIVSIDGAKPIVGTLASRDGAIWIVAGGDTVKLAPTTPEMRAKVGAKVWIVGRRAGAEMTPQSFGVIRDP
jgi:hypothetical protein